MEYLQSTEFWFGLAKIVWINIILSGDNAVVIALAARSLPADQQRRAVVLGSAAAVVLRIGLTVAAAWLLALPYLQILGGLLLLWIGIHLLSGEEEGVGNDKEDYGGMLAAVRTILLADLVMSLDNVIAVAAAARGSPVLLVLGLAISIPLVVFGSTLMIKLMERFPVIVLFGAALIGWVAGETMLGDTALRDFVAGLPWLHYLASAVGAGFVLLTGLALQRRALSRSRLVANSANSANSAS